MGLFVEDGRLTGITGFEEWEEVKEPVSFMEVLEKIKGNSNTRITIRDKKGRIKEKDALLGNLLYRLIANNGSQQIAEILLTSEFYIKG